MFKNLSLKKAYSSAEDNILNDFYIPVLSQAISYKRTTGFFNSSSLIRAARGMASFYSNGGKCELVSGLQLSPEDFAALEAGTNKIEQYIDDSFLNDPYSTYDKIQLNHLRFLSWLIKNDRLVIKIAAVADKTNGIYHEKFAILRDGNGDEISFLGSINETSSGWVSNIEQFLVFRSWVSDEKDYVDINNNRFNEYWQNRSSKVLVFTLPEAIKNKILEIVPNSGEIDDIVRDISEQIEEMDTSEPVSAQTDNRALRDYQKEAIQKWSENEYRGILAMATGSGKTFTALSALLQVSQDKNFLATVAVPYGHLVTQWLNDIKKLLPNFKVIRIDSKNTSWRNELKDSLFNFEEGYADKEILVGTYASLSSKSFIEIFNQYDLGDNVGIIADEVHNFGASNSKKGMLENYKFRIGLSATPARYFDEEGTEEIYRYFGDIVFEYDIHQAIKDGNLTPYEYHVVTADLGEDEMAEYYDITEKMKKVFNRSDPDQEELYARLAIKRSRVLKQAENKVEKTELILDEMIKSENKIEHLLVYCDNLAQLSTIQKLVNSKYHLTTHKFTGEESLDERKDILDKFNSGIYQVILAVKCLDEGVDVPSTDKAIIIASSGNSREYIQRRGRVLRLYEGKTKAIIYDLVVLPPDRNEEAAKIVQREFVRVQDFCKTAQNATEVSRDLYGIMNDYGVYF